MVKKGVTALGIVLVLIGVFALCLVSAIQLLKPRDTDTRPRSVSGIEDADSAAVLAPVGPPP